MRTAWWSTSIATALAALVLATVLAATPVAAQTTGPAIVHVPVTTAPYGQPIPISLTATCATGASCAARLYYRATVPGAVTAIPGIIGEPGFSAVALFPSAATATVDGQNMVPWTGEIPGAAATTTGVDYFIEVEENGSLTVFPGTTSAASTAATGAYLHVHVHQPPLINHVPVPFAFAGTAVDIEVRVTCATSNCAATLYHRTAYKSGTDGPPYSSVAMQQQGPGTAVGASSVLLTYRAQIPGSAVNTDGLAYYIHAVDGHTQAFSPGTTYQGWYAPRDGAHVEALAPYYVYVLEPPHIVHAPVATAPYRQDIPISAAANCAATRQCQATLYYRTAPPTYDPMTSSVLNNEGFASAPMTVTRPGGVDVVTLDGAIPAGVVDTRGIDYRFSISDGTTTSWWPGTSGVNAPPYWFDGVSGPYQHTRVQEPPHFLHVPPTVAPPKQDLAIETELTCATEACSATLFYNTPLDTTGAFQSLPMSRVAVRATTPATRTELWRATIPASAVTTRGLAYYMTASDGYTNTAAPGSFYWGAYSPVDGSNPAPALARFVVRVVDPPHPVHVPVGAAFTGEAIPIDAKSNCATPSCTATLHYRVTGQAWQSTAMAATTTSTAYGNDLLGLHAVIGAANVTTAGVEYRIEITDGYVTETTPTYPVVVTDRPAPTPTTTSTTLPPVTTTTLPPVTTTSTSLPPVTTTTLPPVTTTTTIPPVPTNAPPSVPTLVEPLHGKAFADGEPQVFTVTATDPDGDPYTATITVTNTSTGATRTFPTAPAPSGTASSGTPAPPLTAGSYTWSARATDAKGADGPASSSRTFTVATGPPTPPPGAPNVIAPADGRTFGPGEPQAFVISASSPTATAYSGTVTIRHATGGGVAATVSTSTTLWGLPSTGSTMPPLPPGSYTFTARTTPVGGVDSPPSLARAFTVTSDIANAAPAAPALVTPGAAAALSATDPQVFAVNAVDPDGDAYTATIEVTKSTGTTTTFPTTASTSGADAQGAPPLALAQGDYTWRARATDARGLNSPWSGARPFSVGNQAPVVPTLLSPAPGHAFSNDDAQLFSVASSDAEDDPYTATVYIWTPGGAAVTSFAASPALSGDSSQGLAAPPLPVGDYTWSARSTDAHGATGPESARRVFAVIANQAPRIPTQSAPAVGKAFYLGDPQVFTIGAEDPNGDQYTGTVTVRYPNGLVVDTFDTAPAASGSYSSGMPTLGLAAGFYTWSATATDASGATGLSTPERKFSVSPNFDVPPAAIPSDRATTRASAGPLGLAPDDDSEYPVISVDGRYVAFESDATNLVVGDTNARRDIFVHDRLTGLTERVSVSDSEEQASASGFFESFGPSMSADGRHVAFISSATNLVPGDTNGHQDVFVRDREADTTIRVNLSTTGAEANGATYEAMIAGNGLHVVFSSDASNLVSGDTNSFADIFVRDLATSSGASTERLSTVYFTKAQATGGTFGSRNPSISGNGRVVAFESDATNLMGTLFNDNNNATDVFLHNRNTFWGTALISSDGAPANANGDSNSARVSADGRFVLFDSTASNLDGVAGDTNGVRDVFEYDDQAVTIERVSLNSAQAQPNGHSFHGAYSPEGRYVAFRSSATNLVAGDRNGVDDIFLRDDYTQVTTLVTHDADGHQANNTSGTPSLSADAMHIAFESRSSNLIAADTNRANDVFAYNRRLSLTCVGGALSAVGCLSGYGFKASSDRIGLEDFYGYHAFDAGADTAFLNVSNGNLVVQGSDLDIPGRGLNMRLTHTYNSQKDRGEGPLGHGWRIGVADGKSDDLLGSVVSAALSADVGQILEVVVTQDQFDFFDADGTRHHFIKGGLDGPGWHSPPGVDLELTDYLVGTEQRYKATRPDGVAYEFRPSGAGGGYFVDKVADRHGNQLTFSYSSGRLSTITDAEGRSISFSWSGDYLSSASYSGTTVTYSVDPGTGRLNSISVGGRTTSYAYNAGGLTSITDGRGNTTTFTLDDGMLTEVADRAGKSWSVAYNAPTPSCQPGDPGAAMATCITDPEGHSEVYTSTAEGNLLSYRDAGDPAPRTRSYVWEGNRVVSATDEDGNTSDFVYNDNGQVVVKRDSGSGDEPVTTALVYRDVAPGVADLVEAQVGVGSHDVRTWRFGRSEKGNLTSTTAPDGAVTTFGYDAVGRLTSVTDPKGNTTTYGSYHSSGQPQAITDPLGLTKAFSFDAFGRVTSTVDRNGHTWGVGYDARGNVTSKSSPLGTATFGYDLNDNQTSATPPGGATVTRWYDARDLLTESSSTVSGVLRKTTYEYDLGGQLATVNEPRAFAGSPTVTQTVSYLRYPNNRVSAMVDENGFSTQVTYTGTGRVRTSLEPAGTVGNHLTSYTYNRRGQVTSVIESGHKSPTTNAYSLHGELLSTRTPKGSFTSFVYDKAGRLVTTVDAQGRRSSRTYDPNGNLVAQSQPEGAGGQLTTTYSYTARNEIASESDPADGGHVVEYVYDNEGRQRFRHDRYNGMIERTAEQAYRTDGALLSTTASGPGLATHQSVFAYDTVGNMTSATATVNGTNVSAVTFGYNEAFEPTSWTETIHDPSGTPRSKSGSYGYQPDGLLAARTVDNLTTGYEHTPNGREARVTPWGGSGSFDNDYYDNGLLRKSTLPNGATVDQLFDQADRLNSRLALKTDLTLLSSWADIEYDDDDQRISEGVVQVQPADGGVTFKAGGGKYSYDSLGRLIEAHHPFDPDDFSAYTLDDGGNILHDGDTAFTYSKNQLMRRVGTEVEQFDDGSTTSTAESSDYEYDSLGNQSSEATTATVTRTISGEAQTRTDSTRRTHSYDAASHPTRVASLDGSYVDYAYDALDRLVRRVEHPTSGPDTVTLFFHDGPEDQVALETDGGGTVQTRYLLDSQGQPLGQDKGGSRSYYIDDPRGNLTQQVDGAQNVVAVYGYDPYGKEKKSLTKTAGGSANWDSRLRFQMAPRDPATGAYNLGPRLLNPGINRFVGADSYVGAAANMGLAADPLTGNRYLYAGANPAGLIDDGHGWGWLKGAARFGKGVLKNRVFQTVVMAVAVSAACSTGILCGVAVGGVVNGGLRAASHLANAKTRTLQSTLNAFKGGIAEGAIGGGIAAKLKAPITVARQAYVDAARALAAKGTTRVAAGEEAMAVARAVVDERNVLKVAAREGMPRVVNKLAEWRNMVKYTNPLGPTVDHLSKKSAEQIIEGAGRTNKWINWLVHVS